MGGLPVCVDYGWAVGSSGVGFPANSSHQLRRARHVVLSSIPVLRVEAQGGTEMGRLAPDTYVAVSLPLDRNRACVRFLCFCWNTRATV